MQGKLKIERNQRFVEITDDKGNKMEWAEYKQGIFTMFHAIVYNQIYRYNHGWEKYGRGREKSNSQNILYELENYGREYIKNNLFK